MRDTLKLGSQGATVRELQTMLNTVGANINVDGDFGEITFDTVCDFQTWKILEPDGIVGPKTWAALEDAIRIHAHMERVRQGDKLKLAGEKAIERARQLWQTDIFDPKVEENYAEACHSKTMIDDFIRHGLGWTWEPTYLGDGRFEWCGAFAAACWYEIKPQLRKDYFASTYRLDRYGRYQSAFGEENKGSGRLILDLDEKSTPGSLSWEPRAGDILLIGPKGFGQHICLVEHFDATFGTFHTIEGNGNGEGPHGEHQQGVVKGERFLGAHYPGSWCARRLIRPSVEDLV